MSTKPANATFEDLNVTQWLIKQCKKLAITSPTPVQQHCIPPILAGKDCIGCSKTGSGKTLAFALPILQDLSEDPYGIFALILTPTRELAFQIAEQFAVLGKPIWLKHCVIVGGKDMMWQSKHLADQPHVVISTPGRLADHLESCDTFTLKKIKYLVLDEADRLLEGHFEKQLETIFNALPKNKQTLLFSATLTRSIQKKISLNEPFIWSHTEELTVPKELTQYYILTPKLVKDAYFVYMIRELLEKKPTTLIIAFVATCKQCQLLSMALTSLGFDNTALHSMRLQQERLAALAKFKSNSVKILMATDVASRGLDIPSVDVVINYNVPKVPIDYIHRVGRTARAGRGGTAITLLTKHDILPLYAIEDMINTKLELFKIKEKEVLDIMLQVNVSIREAGVRLEETDYGEKQAINKRKRLILQGIDPDEKEKKVKKKSKKNKVKQEEKIKNPSS